MKYISMFLIISKLFFQQQQLRRDGDGDVDDELLSQINLI